ncbi:TPA: hypothetical protein DEP96_03815 [Candidatus Uhrbacteria bacterium]|nr:hypothetical protein [Candidatus Uhrbacteria bacterium]
MGIESEHDEQGQDFVAPQSQTAAEKAQAAAFLLDESLRYGLGGEMADMPEKYTMAADSRLADQEAHPDPAGQALVEKFTADMNARIASVEPGLKGVYQDQLSAIKLKRTVAEQVAQIKSMKGEKYVQDLAA